MQSFIKDNLTGKLRCVNNEFIIDIHSSRLVEAVLCLENVGASVKEVVNYTNCNYTRILWVGDAHRVFHLPFATLERLRLPTRNFKKRYGTDSVFWDRFTHSHPKCADCSNPEVPDLEAKCGDCDYYGDDCICAIYDKK